MRIYWIYFLKHKNEIFWIVCGQLLMLIGGFAGIKLLTNIMGPVGYGELALGLTVAGLILTGLYSPVGQVLYRYFSIYQQKKQLGLFFYASKKIYIYISIPIFLFALVFYFFLSRLVEPKWGVLVFSGMLFGIISGVNSAFSFILNAVRERKVLALHQGGEVILRVCLASIFVYFFINRGYCAILAYSLAASLIVFSQIKFISKNKFIGRSWCVSGFSKLEISKIYHEFYSYGAPIILWSVFMIITNYSDKWIVQGYMSEANVGIYTALYQIANVPMTMVLGVLTQFIIPVLFERAGDIANVEKRELVNTLFQKVVWISVLIVACMVLGISLFAKEIIAFLTADVFAEHYRYLPILLIAASFFNLGQILAVKGMYLNRTKIYIFPKVIYAIVFIVLALILTKKYGFLGISFSVAISSFVYMCSVLYSNKRYLSETL